MTKYTETMVVFEEIPDEITLAINISNCPCKCPRCHSKYLWEDIGDELSFKALDSLILANDGITCVCFMGGDADINGINSLAEHVRSTFSGIKIGWYSGRDELSKEINTSLFDYIKIGRYDEKCGPLNSEKTNQRLYKVDKKSGKLSDITHKFWRKKA